MLETSKDVLNITLSVSVGALSIFICWGLYYLIASARSLFRVIRELETIITRIGGIAENINDQVKKSFEKIDGLVGSIKDKINGAGSYFIIISEVLKNIFKFIREKKQDNQEEDDEAEAMADSSKNSKAKKSSKK